MINKKLIMTIYMIILFIFILFLAVFYIFINKPTLKINGKKEINISLNEEYKEVGYQIKYYKKNDAYLTKVVNNINNKKIGTYEVIYEYNNQKKIRIVNVIDDVAPVITLKGDETTYVCKNTKYKEEGYEVTDNYDTDLTKKVKVEVLDNKIIYEVEDASKNKAIKERELLYGDKTPPVITLNTDKVSINKGKDFIETYNAIDNCDGDITSKIERTSNVDKNKIGTYQIKYTVVDSSNNKAEKTKTVIVTEKKMYIGSTIYLTFDDGPSLDITPKILDLLKKHNIKATFFVINRNSNTDYLIKRAYNEGHTIGLHTSSHNYSKIYANETAYFNDLANIENKVIKITGTSSKIIRFPGGSSNTVSRNYNKGIMTRLTKQVTEKGYIYQDWNVGTGDSSHQNSTKICNAAKTYLSSGTNIILMHDFSGNNGTYEALKCIIEYGLDRGYSFSNITSFTKQIHHRIGN